MPSWAETLASRASRFRVLVRIEGVGDAGGQWVFTSGPAPGDPATHHDLLAELPDILSERVELDGGVPEAGGCTVQLVDVGDILTAALATESPPIARLAAAAASGDTTLDVGDSTGLDGRVLWLGSEAVLVTAEPDGSTVEVTRGYLGTEAVPHVEGAPIFGAVNYLEGRRFEVSLEGGGEERPVGGFVVDRLDWSDDLNVWLLRGSSQQRYLDRRAPIAPREAVARIVTEVEAIMHEPPGMFLSLWPDGEIYVWNERTKEIAALDPRYDSGQVILLRDRGLFGSQQEEVKRGDRLRQVFLAGRDLRFSPGPSPSTSRASGTWEPATHWVDLLLILLLSSADESDGLELANVRTTGSDWSRSNFASLPPGYGAGVPHDLIDWASFEAIRARTWAWRLPYLVYGWRSESFAEFISREMLRPLGATLSFELGRLRLILSRAPAADEAADLAITPDTIIRRETAPGVYLPDVRASRNRADIVSAITFTVGPSELEATYRDGGYAGTYGQRGWYGATGAEVQIDLPGGDPGLAEFYGQRAAARLYRNHRPPVQLEARVDASAIEGALPGIMVQVTLPEVPNMRGVRGWQGTLAEVTEREVRLESARSSSAERAAGATVQLKLRRHAEGLRIGRIAPSARIASVDPGPPVLVTVTSSRYTRPDAPLGLPTEDAAGFEAGDIVCLISLDGVRYIETAEVRSVSGDVIELDDDLGGYMAAGGILTTADADDASPEQRGRYVFAADGAATPPSIGGTADPVWTWGEP